MSERIDIEQLSSRVAGWASLRFYPSRDEKSARLEIVKAVASMAGSYDRACWIVDQLMVLTNVWPGLVEVRGIFCHRFPPADGITTDSALCPEGHIPDELKVGFKSLPALAAPDRDPRDTSLPESLKAITEGKRLPNA